MSNSKKRILFVDDDVNFLEGLRRMLREQHQYWDMQFMYDTDEALRKIQDSQVDAVILDVKMPGTDGMELLKLIRESQAGRDVPVTMLTGSLEFDLKRRVLDLGATDLLDKPVNREDLLARIYAMLRLKASQDELKALNKTLDQKVRQRTAELELARLDVVWRLAKAGEFRDEETGDHVVRVGCYCRVIAEQIGMARSFVESIYLTGPLHDIGKIGIPDSILLNPGRLTPQEWRIMQRHCEIGAKILSEEPKEMTPFLQWRGGTFSEYSTGNSAGFLEMATSIAMYHHERWDGTGYPRTLAGDEIPLEARIASIADVYDALRSDRPYKDAYSHGEAMEIMRSEAAGKHFDPIVYEAFEAREDEFQQIRNDITNETSVTTEAALHV